MILDSGKRRDFGTGSVRDCADGKGRCDLLPLGEMAEHMDVMVLTYIELYIRGGDTEELWNAVQTFWAHYMDGNMMTMFLEVAIQYEEGAKKYAERNWEKGQPLHVYIDSAVRHYLKHLRGDTDEPHDRAFVWNILCAIWTHRNKPELIDLPFAEKKEGAETCL